jgi:Yip1-like protein
VSSAVERTPSLQREWWLRALAVLQSPTAVFAALRDDSNDAAQARQEPILAIVLLAGMAGVLSTTVAGRLLDDRSVDGVSVAVWTFLGGAIYAAVVYWLGGALLHGAGRALGSLGSYRRARHVLGFAVAPLALSLLLVWPVRLAVHGSDVFRTGGEDSGAGDRVFEALALGSGLWTAGLLVSGMRAVNGWPWPRSLVAVALAGAPVALIVALSRL